MCDKIIQLYLEYKDANKSTLFLPKSWVYCRRCLIRTLYFSTDVWCCEFLSFSPPNSMLIETW